MKLNRELYATRKRLGWTQRALEIQSGLSHKVVSKLEKTDTEEMSPNLALCFRTLGIDPDKLMRLDSDKAQELTVHSREYPYLSDETRVRLMMEAVRKAWQLRYGEDSLSVLLPLVRTFIDASSAPENAPLDSTQLEQMRGKLKYMETRICAMFNASSASPTSPGPADGSPTPPQGASDNHTADQPAP